MIRLLFPNIEELKQLHYEAVKSYVADIMRKEQRKDFYQNVIVLPGFESYDKEYDFRHDTFDWLKQFVLADCSTLASWVANCPKLLKFDYMKKVYINRFSNGISKYVDRQETYNSYALFEKMNLKVCPYCEHEFLDVVEVMQGTQTKRTIEFDHFYPKGSDEYPALAMCFYNLIPSCKSCNQLKMTNPVAANPYEANIENLSYFYSNQLIGVNYTAVSETDFTIGLHTEGNMVVNQDTLGLEQRYQSLNSTACQLLKSKQNFDDDKLAEMERMGFGAVEELKRSFFGKPRSEALGTELHTKMKEDLIGY